MSERWEAVIKAWPLMTWMKPENIAVFLHYVEEDLNVFDDIVVLAHKCEKNYDYNEMDALEHFQKFHTEVFTLIKNANSELGENSE